MFLTTADQHLPDGPRLDKNTVRVMRDVLDHDRPDFVVLNGDLINGESTYIENSTAYVDMLVKPMIDRGLTWGTTYGNHDHTYSLSSELMLERERGFRGSRTQRMVQDPNAGVSNYYLPVYAAGYNGSRDAVPELLLWFFDSRGGSYYKEKSRPRPNWVDQSVVDWFLETNEQLRNQSGGRVIPSLAFVHIPIQATYMLQTKLGVDPQLQPGINDDVPVSQQSQGFCHDGRASYSCSYGGRDVPFMQALVSTPGLMGLFYGHDHGNTWCYRWDTLLSGMSVKGNGINLCFGQHAGYGGYGDWVRGARQIVVTREKLKNFTVDTYLRLESGLAAGAVSLNATFGHDIYPETPNVKSGLY